MADRTIIDFSDEFYKRAELALRLARARGEFSGDKPRFIREKIAVNEQQIMQLLDFPELTSALKAIPVLTEPRTSALLQSATTNPNSDSAPHNRDIFNNLFPDRSRPTSKPLALKILKGVTFYPMGPWLEAWLWIDIVDKIYTAANGTLSAGNRDFLDEKTESFANFKQPVKLTFPSETSMGSARYLENICRRYKVPCPPISSPPD